MNTAIIYSSKTGNTRKVAQRIQAVIPESDIFDIANIPNLDNYHFIIIGCWIDKGTADAKALEFISSLKNRDIAFFYTLGAYPESQHAIDCNVTLHKLFTDNDNIVHGSFWCHGRIDPALTKWYETLPLDHPHGLNPDRVKRLAVAEKHPDEEDFINAENYFKHLTSKLVVMS